MDTAVRAPHFSGATGDGAEVRLHLAVAESRIAEVGIENRRPFGLLSVLIGRPAAEAPDLLRRLFPICGWAHAIACRHAITAAEDARHAATDAGDRDRLRAELAVAHAWRSLIDWRTLLGLEPELAPLRRVVANAGHLRAAHASAPGAALNALAEALEQAVFGSTPPPDAGAQTLIDWTRSTQSPAADLLAAVADSPLAIAAHPRTHLLSMSEADRLDAGLQTEPEAVVKGPDWFAARLAADPDFGRQPTVDGMPTEVGAYADCPAGDRQRFDQAGPVAARLLAMLGAAAGLVAELRAATSRHAEPCPASAALTAPGTGGGVAATVRGPLAYWVRLEHGRIAALRSVAPTEWGLHPRGPLARLLRGLPAAGAARTARLAAAAFDPCASIDIVLAEPADA